MVWCCPTRVTGGKIFWDTLKANDNFLLQKHKGHGSTWGSAIVTLRSLRISNAGTFRIIFAPYPHHTIAEATTLEEINDHWTWILDHLKPKLESLHNWYDYALLFFNENYSQNRFDVNEIEQTPFWDTCGSPKSKESRNQESEESEENEENEHKRKQEETKGNSSECVICYENEPNTVIVSCGHQALCDSCATSLTFNECPICRTPITGMGIIKVFKC